MLSDLIQYFTNDVDYCDEDIDYSKEGFELLGFLRLIILYSHDENDRKNLLKDINDYRYDLVLYQYCFDLAYSMNDHLCDWLVRSQNTNAIWELILRTIYKSHHFDIYYQEISVYDLYNGDLNEINADSDSPKWNFDSKVDFAINDFINDVIDGLVCSSKDDTDKKFIDEYDAEMIRLIIGTIRFKRWNRGTTRKLRKSYARNELVRKMFNALDISMINGQFVMLCGYFHDGYDSYSEIRDVYAIMDGLKAMMDYFDKKPVPETIEYKATFNEFAREVYREESENYRIYQFFEKIKSIRNGEREIIL